MAQDAKKGRTDNIAVTAGLMVSGTNSSLASEELTRARSVEKFVFETDKSQLPVIVHVDPVSSSSSDCVLFSDSNISAICGPNVFIFCMLFNCCIVYRNIMLFLSSIVFCLK